MQTTFRNKRISAMLGVLPEKDVLFEDEVSNYSFPERQTMRLKKVMGYNKHSLAKDTTTVYDLAEYGLRYIFDNDWISPDDVGAVVVVTLCPDYYVPHISTMLQGKFGLSDEVICLDVAQGCCGFLVGLLESFMLLEHIDKKVVLINGDVLSHKTSKQDRNDFPLMGDAASLTIIENAESQDIYYEMHMDGVDGDALKIPAGGFRMPATADTAVMEDTGDGNFRSLNDIHMDGSAVFNFVETAVPPMLEDAWKRNNKTVDDFDYFLFHQPNKFMLKKLAQKVNIPEEKMPMNLVENFGNSSGACIPMTLTYNYSDEFKKNEYECCLSAFGSGLAYGTVLMKMGRFEHCELIRSDL